MRRYILNSDWKYVGIYADEGITETLDYKRDGFMKMMQDATNNKFDMIITYSLTVSFKDISYYFCFFIIN